VLSEATQTDNFFIRKINSGQKNETEEKMEGKLKEKKTI
jgi:hypothetical protein